MIFVKLRLEAQVLRRVQGVGYRFFVQNSAKLLGLKGYVKNLPNGSVEVVAEGAKKELNDLLLAMKKGPGLARISEIKEKWSSATREFEDFLVK